MSILKTEIGTAIPNFLDSEVGLVTKTAQIPQSMGQTDGDRKTVFAGTVFPANTSAATGIVFQDVDVTDGDAIGSVMVAGRVISDRVNAAQAALKNIVFVGANATVRGYSVTYEKDGGAGDVPVDATMYADGEIVQLSKSYPLTKSSKSQIGWALSSGGNAVDTVTIAGADVKVYPVFEAQSK
jgi:hypothetical protein